MTDHDPNGIVETMSAEDRAGWREVGRKLAGAECSDGLKTADLPETDAAVDAATVDCLNATRGEYGFVATLGQAEEALQTGVSLTPAETLALAHACKVIWALFADVHL